MDSLMKVLCSTPAGRLLGGLLQFSAKRPDAIRRRAWRLIENSFQCGRLQYARGAIHGVYMNRVRELKEGTMTKLRMMLAAVLLAAGCTPPPAPAEPTPAEKAAAPKGTCFCKASSCL